MSEPSGEKTEQPTDKKIRDARKRGQVAKSADVNSTWLLIFIFAFLGVFRDFYLRGMMDMITLPALFYSEPFEDAFPHVFMGLVRQFSLLVIPLVGGVALMGVLINFIQVGPLLSFEILKPDLKKLNPVEGAKKIFSKKNLVEFIKSCLKVAVLSYLIYRIVIWAIDPLLKIPYAGLGAVFEILIAILKIFAIIICLAYATIAIADYFYQQAKYIKDLRMTKDEVKREFKEMEGDPQIKGERKQLHQELAMSDTVKSTKKASALVTNPTHYAVAIFYKEGVVKLPVVNAKGKDHIARMMIQVAEENNIPILCNPPLARSLHAQVEEYNYIPTDLMQPVVQVLRWAAQLQNPDVIDKPEAPEIELPATSRE